MAKKVNLDALIPREDFDVNEAITGTTRNISTLGIRDLEFDSFFFSALRKPDFQRETNEWEADRICSLVQSFLDGDLIPAVILWRNTSGYTFVIDGAHRLSALASWINNDFGDGKISKSFYDAVIPDEQVDTAEITRNKVRKEIGLYSDYQLSIKNPEKVSSDISARSKTLGSLAIQVQWVEGDAKKAEASFFKINQQAAAIDKTELKLLEARRKPNGVATRAIIRSGRGHKYWSSFDKDNQDKVQIIAKEINDILFKPTLKTPIKTLDIPIAGKNLSSQGQMLVLEFVNMVNNINKKDKIEDDFDGKMTISYLKASLRVARVINSIHPSSLGLHPAIYFYAKNGRHKPASFLAAIDFVLALSKSNKTNDFIRVREVFEEALIYSEDIIQQIVRKYRSSAASYPYIKDFYFDLMNQVSNSNDAPNSLSSLLSLDKYNYLTAREVSMQEIKTSKFSSDRKSEVFIKEALRNAIKCKICGGYIHVNSITIDHKERKEDGGLGTVDNAQLAHPYCNSTYKN